MEPVIIALGATRIIVGFIFFLLYIIFAGLVGYDLARKRYINALACFLVCCIFICGIIICVIL